MTPLVALAFALLSLQGIKNGTKDTASGGPVVRVKADEEVILFPTLSRRDPDDTTNAYWEVPVHGWIYEPEYTSLRRRAFLKLLRKVLDLEKGEEASEVLERRLRPFLYDNERGKALTVELLRDDVSTSNRGDATTATISENEINPRSRKRMPRSGRDGHFRGNLHVSDQEFDTCQIGDACSLALRLVQPNDNDSKVSGRVFTGVTYLLPPTGLSVISDIDDTIKLSNVLDKKTLMRNTFLEEFKPVPGMSRLYQDWSQQLGATFHFVSSSPWQLYRELSTFMEKEDFPSGSFHLKQIRVKPSSLLNLLADPFETKCRTIGNIIDSYPGRTFVLMGDTGEKDPEVYGEICRRYPYQVWRVYLRDAGDESCSNRFDRAFANVPSDVWTVFNDPSKITLPDRP